MQKVVEFLEKHVQWVALSLGGVFVLYMIYSYVLTPPATVEIAGKTLTAGEVDDYIRTETAEPLALRMKSTTPIDVNVQEFDKGFLATIANDGVKYAALDFLPPVPRTGGDGGEIKGPGTDPNNPPQIAGDVTLPVPPKAVPFEVKPGRSMVVLSGIGGLDANGMPVAAAAPVVVAGADPANPFAVPVAADPAIAGAAAPADRDWVTAFFKVSMADLDKAWKDAKLVPPAVPQAARQTAFLQVIMEREEQTGVDAAGKPVWGNRTTVKPLANIANHPPLPDPAMPPAVQLQHLQWADKNQAGILQPSFYMVASGDNWAGPGAPVVPVGAVGQNIFDDPNAGPGLTPPTGATTDPKAAAAAAIKAERDAERARKKAAADAKREQQRQPQQRRGGAGDRPPGMPNFQVYDPNRPNARPGGGYPPTGYPGATGYPGMPGYPTGMNPGGQPGFPGQPAGAPAAVPTPVPQSQFIPAAGLPDLTIWSHDDGVEAGKTYRYRIRYAIKNPVYNTNNVAAPAISGVFAVVQDEKQASDWTGPVSIAARTQYFLASVYQNKATVKVFRWQEGRQNAKEFTVFPGDLVGAKDGPIDFSTGVTLVDVRDGGTVLLMDPRTGLFSRSFDSDKRNPDLKKLETESTGGNAAAAGPGGAPVAAGR